MSKIQFSDFETHISNLSIRNPRNPQSLPATINAGQAGAVRNSGQMLIIVLWVMGLVSLAVGALTVRSTHELRLARIPLASLQRSAIAQAGVEQAIVVLEKDNPAVDHLNETWATGIEEGEGAQVLQDISIGSGAFSVGKKIDGEFVVGLIDEERKLNLNWASAAEILRLIELVYTGESDPIEIRDAILDWRKATEPEGPFCADRIPACRNDDFASVDELRLVPAVSEEVFEALAPHVTVYGNGSVNVNTADPVVLAALGLSEEEVTSIIEQRVTSPFQSYPHPRLKVVSSAFAVPVEAKLANVSGITRLEVVIDRKACGEPGRQGCILYWSRK